MNNIEARWVDNPVSGQKGSNNLPNGVGRRIKRFKPEDLRLAKFGGSTLQPRGPQGHTINDRQVNIANGSEKKLPKLHSDSRQTPPDPFATSASLDIDAKMGSKIADRSTSNIIMKNPLNNQGNLKIAVPKMRVRQMPQNKNEGISLRDFLETIKSVKNFETVQNKGFISRGGGSITGDKFFNSAPVRCMSKNGGGFALFWGDKNVMVKNQKGEYKWFPLEQLKLEDGPNSGEMTATFSNTYNEKNPTRIIVNRLAFEYQILRLLEKHGENPANILKRS